MDYVLWRYCREFSMPQFWPPLHLFLDTAGCVKLGIPSREDRYVSPTILTCVQSNPWVFRLERHIDKSDWRVGELMKQVKRVFQPPDASRQGFSLAESELILLKLAFG